MKMIEKERAYLRVKVHQEEMKKKSLAPTEA